MGIWGKSLVSTVVMLACVSCTHDVSGSATAGDNLPERQRTTETSAEPERVTECTDCDDDEVDAALDNPVVARPKKLVLPPNCDTLLPLSMISQVVDANAVPKDASNVQHECLAQYETPDLTRTGQVWVGFDGLAPTGPVAVSEFDGNTLLENQSSNQICEYGVAVDDTVDRYDDGGWLDVKVISYNGNPPPCPLARQLLEIAFGNLPDA